MGSPAVVRRPRSRGGIASLFRYVTWLARTSRHGVDGVDDHGTRLFAFSRGGHHHQPWRVTCLHTAVPAGRESIHMALFSFPRSRDEFCLSLFPRDHKKAWFLVLLGGLAHVTKPIGQLTVNLITGWPFGSFRYGVLYPFASHPLFGMIGGLIGALIVLGIQRYSDKSS